MTATATLVHTSSKQADNALRIARVAAGGRSQAERVAREAREAARRATAKVAATAFVADAVEAGAVYVGFKICAEDGKFRLRVAVADAVAVLVAHMTSGDDVEAWGIDADGEHVGEVW